MSRTKSTVVSICNFPIVNEYKPTVNPAYYTIPEADPISVLVVEDGWCAEYIGDDKSIRRDIFSREIADSIVNDYCIAQICIGNGGRPGLFVVDGEYDAEDISKKFKSELKEAKEKHLIWVKELVTMADDLWHVKKQHRQITNSMRFAAKYLGLSREWVEITNAELAINCPACGKQLPESAAICFNCQCIVNEAKYRELKFAQRV